MSKDAYWFPHDSNARSDPKMLRLRMVGGVEGVGFYWCIIELLREQDNYKATSDEIDCLEFEMRPSQKGLLPCILESKLLIKDEDTGLIYSPSLLRRMEQWDEKKRKRQDAGRKGGLQKSSNARAMLEQKPSKAVANPTQNRTEQKSTEEYKTEQKKKYSPKAACAGLDWLDSGLWAEWVDHKKKKGAGVTERAMKKNIKTLTEMGTHRAKELIETAIDKGWKDFYEPKGATPGGPKETQHEKNMKVLREVRRANGIQD